ncbi:MAG TPA: iron-containing alcohol dehydrogenase [Candidatus Butyricicoccus stercorigallinarum]|nr:iron-containing alcohol dehydrogenase [Candidatus Butyricicoccus stercorigallinarum]
MKAFTFSVPQEIIFGSGSLNRLPELLKKQNAARVLLISGPHLNKMGVVGRLRDSIVSAGAACETFTDVEANPSMETVEKAAAAYHAFGADAIVAIGGGSPMDVAKAVGVVVTYGGSIAQYEGVGTVPGPIVPLIAIPTTAGTGSEVTTFSVITDHSRNYKLTVGSQYLIPRCALLDPELLTTTPAGVAAACGMDALVHALEAYLSRAASPFSDAMAEKALALIGRSLRAFVADRANLEAASDMLAGSLFAGIAFSWARLGNVHAMAHPLGGFFNVPHGLANAILLPVVVDYNAIADHDGKYETIYRAVAASPKAEFSQEMLADELRRLAARIGIPATLAEVGVDAEKIPEMAADAMKSGNIYVNPRTSTQKDIEQLYRRAMGDKT